MRRARTPSFMARQDEHAQYLRSGFVPEDEILRYRRAPLAIVQEPTGAANDLMQT